VTRDVRAEEVGFRGEPGVELAVGDLVATFLPGLGMTGVSLRHRGRERLHLRDGVEVLRAGRTAGLPLLAPWANRLSRWSYEFAGVAVDLEDRSPPVRADPATGLPIHGLLVGQPGWAVDALRAEGDAATLRASRPVDAPAFPFPHTVTVDVRLDGDRMTVATTVTPTGRRTVPVSFGWHPFLCLPEADRSAWRLRAPERDHVLLDDRGIPTGARADAAAEDAPIGDRTYDDLYALRGAPGGEGRELAFALDDGTGIAMVAGEGYPYAQVWVPEGSPYAALEPMTAPTDALVNGHTPVAEPGDRFTATFALVVT
jgi:aldose 1-epimerase